MSKKRGWNWIPTQINLKFFNEFILDHLIRGTRGPRRKISDFKIFNYILKVLHTGCQWENLPIDLDSEGKPEISYSRVYKIYVFWRKRGVFDRIFTNSIKVLHEKGYLDTSVIHGDGTTTAAKKGATI